MYLVPCISKLLFGLAAIINTYPWSCSSRNPELKPWRTQGTCLKVTSVPSHNGLVSNLLGCSLCVFCQPHSHPLQMTERSYIFCTNTSTDNFMKEKDDQEYLKSTAQPSAVYNKNDSYFYFVGLWCYFISSRPILLLNFVNHSVFWKSQESYIYRQLELFVHSGKKVGRILSAKSIINQLCLLKSTHKFKTHIPSFSSCKVCILCMILAFQQCVNEVFALMGCYTALTGF